VVLAACQEGCRRAVAHGVTGTGCFVVVVVVRSHIAGWPARLQGVLPTWREGVPAVPWGSWPGMSFRVLQLTWHVTPSDKWRFPDLSGVAAGPGFGNEAVLDTRACWPTGSPRRPARLRTSSPPCAVGEAGISSSPASGAADSSVSPWSKRPDGEARGTVSKGPVTRMGWVENGVG
jgi:hypothetical protein